MIEYYSGNINTSDDVKPSNSLTTQKKDSSHITSKDRVPINANDNLQLNENRAAEGIEHDRQAIHSYPIGNTPLYDSTSGNHSEDGFYAAHITPTPQRRASSASQHSALETGTLSPKPPNLQTFPNVSSGSQLPPTISTPISQDSSILDIILEGHAKNVDSKREIWLDPSYISGKKFREVKRERNGRFASKKVVLSTTGSIKEPSVDASPSSQLAVDGTKPYVVAIASIDHTLQAGSPAILNGPASVKEPAVSENQVSVQNGPNGNDLVVKLEKKSKAKRAAAKSPYFTPPSLSLPKKTASKVPQAGEEVSDTTEKSLPTTPKKKGSGKSETPKRRSPGGIVSCIPFPPLSSPHFGLIQEKLAHDPFRLLIAVTFLIRTKGKDAIPVFYELLTKYPTPESLVAADKEDIVPIIRHLGLQNQRAATYQTYAKIWLEDPPTKGRRYAVRGYPTKDSGRDIKNGEILADDDERDAWEIGHMTQGPYAIDSWRIFCRDILRGKSEGWNGEGNTDMCFQPEWMRVLPEDKELRAYLRWMWLKEGFEWDPYTGEKEVASKELMSAAIEGRIAWDDLGGMRIITMAEDGSCGDSIGEPLNHLARPVKDDVEGKEEVTGTDTMDWEI